MVRDCSVIFLCYLKCFVTVLIIKITTQDSDILHWTDISNHGIDLLTQQALFAEITITTELCPADDVCMLVVNTKTKTKSPYIST